MFDDEPRPATTPDAEARPFDRRMRITPLDLRQQRFKGALRGFDRTEVVAFLTEAADDYEHALRELDKLRQDVARLDAQVADFRGRESQLRDTMLTAQHLSTQVREQAQKEGSLIVQEAETRADQILQRAQTRLHDIEREIDEMRLRRRDVEGSLEASIQALYRALEFIRDQGAGDKAQQDERVLLHRPRAGAASSPSQQPQQAQPAQAHHAKTAEHEG